MALVSTRLEDWLPEPLTVATRIVKSFTARAGITMELSVVTVRPSPGMQAAVRADGLRPLGPKGPDAVPLQTKVTQCSHSHTSFFTSASAARSLERPPTQRSRCAFASPTASDGGCSTASTAFERGDEAESIVEFDSAFGMYSLDLDAPRSIAVRPATISSSSPVTIAAITETLYDAPAPAPRKPLILSGTAPQSFLYVQPTFVLFDKSRGRLQEADRAAARRRHPDRERPRRLLRLALSRPAERAVVATARDAPARRRRTSIITFVSRFRFRCRGPAGRRAFSST